MLLIDKYEMINDSYLNDMNLNIFINNDDFPHLLIKGNNGCGKRVLIKKILERKFKTNVTMNSQIYIINHQSKKGLEVEIKYSKYHFQINPSSNGVYDRYIIQGFILKILKTYPLYLKYYIIVIEDSHLLTIDAQQCLRRILETYTDTCKFIFLSDKNNT